MKSSIKLTQRFSRHIAIRNSLTIIPFLLAILCGCPSQETTSSGSRQIPITPETSKTEVQQTKIKNALMLSSNYLESPKTTKALTTVLTDKDELVRSAGKIAARRLGKEISSDLGPLFESGDKEFSAACSIVQEIGPNAKQWIPQLRKISLDGLDGVSEQYTKRMCMICFSAIGEDSVKALPEVVESLQSEDFNVQLTACMVVESLGPIAALSEQGDEIKEQLFHLLENGNLSTRGWSARAIGAFYSSEEVRKNDPEGFDRTLETLIEKLNAFTQPEKQRVLIGISHLGPAAKEAAEKVRLLCETPKNKVVPHALFAQGKIEGFSEKSVKQLAAHLADPNHKTDTIALLGRMGPDAAPALDALCGELANPEASIRETTLLALENFGSVALPKKAEIEILLSDEDLLVRAAAEDCIERISK